jgi:hypothetical protein
MSQGASVGSSRNGRASRTRRAGDASSGVAGVGVAAVVVSNRRRNKARGSRPSPGASCRRAGTPRPRERESTPPTGVKSSGRRPVHPIRPTCERSRRSTTRTVTRLFTIMHSYKTLHDHQGRLASLAAGARCGRPQAAVLAGERQERVAGQPRRGQQRAPQTRSPLPEGLSVAAGPACR